MEDTIGRFFKVLEEFREHLRTPDVGTDNPDRDAKFNIKSVLEDAIIHSVYSGSFPPDHLIALYISVYGG